MSHHYDSLAIVRAVIDSLEFSAIALRLSIPN